jgi:hypothetical protein
MHHLFFRTSRAPQRKTISTGKGSSTYINVKLMPSSLVKRVLGRKADKCFGKPVGVKNGNNILFDKRTGIGEGRMGQPYIDLHLHDSKSWLVKQIDFVEHNIL